MLEGDGVGSLPSSSELLDLNEGNISVDLGLEGLGDEETEVVAEVLAVNEVAIDEVGSKLVVDVEGGDLKGLLGHDGDHGDELLEGAVASAIGDGEDEVEEAGDVLGAHGELLDLEAVLAGDGLVSHLDQHVVDVADQGAELGGETVEVEGGELGANSVDCVGDLVHVLLALVGLAEAGRVGNVLLNLGAKGEASHKLEDGVISVEGSCAVGGELVMGGAEDTVDVAEAGGVGSVGDADGGEEEGRDELHFL